MFYCGKLEQDTAYAVIYIVLFPNCVLLQYNKLLSTVED